MSGGPSTRILFQLSETNGAGDTTSYEYDARGNFTKLTDPAGNETVWVYEDDRPVKRIAPGGLVTTYARDGHGALVGIETPSGDKLAIERDAHGRAVAFHDAGGLLAGRAYDEHHNLAQAFDRRGARVSYAYGALGCVVARMDSLGNWARAEYDAVDNLTAIVRSDGTEERFAYDAMGKLCRRTDALGQVTLMEYAGTGVLAAVTTPDGARWTFEHDSEERLICVKNPCCEVYEFEYDRAGHVERERTFDGRILEYGYDAAGRLSRISYPDRTFREFVYDALSRVVEERAPHGGILYERDALGQILQATVDEVTGKVVTSFLRDALGRIVRETQGTRTIEYAYDAKGRRSSRTLPDGPTTRYVYDELAALSAVEHGGYRLTIERDAFGSEHRLHLEEGAVDILTAHDAAGRMTARRVTAMRGSSPRVLHDRRYEYGRRHLARIDDQEWGTTRFVHDVMGRLVEARAPKLRETFGYNVAGALTSISRESGTGASTVDFEAHPGNVLATAGAVRYEHDLRGRRTKRIEGARVTAYLWDCRDRLREVRLPGGERVLYTYDAFGRRVRKAIVPRERADYARMVKLALAEGREKLPQPRVTEYLWDGDFLAAKIRSGRADAELRPRPRDHGAAPTLRRRADLRVRERPLGPAQGPRRRGGEARVVRDPQGLGRSPRRVGRPGGEHSEGATLPAPRAALRPGDQALLHTLPVLRSRDRAVVQRRPAGLRCGREPLRLEREPRGGRRSLGPRHVPHHAHA